MILVALAFHCCHSCLSHSIAVSTYAVNLVTHLTIPNSWCSAENVTPLFAGFLAHEGQQKTAYGLLTAAWAAVAIAKLFFTQQFFSYVFDITHPHVGLLGLQRLAGFSSLAPAVAAYTLAVSPSSVS